MNNVLASPRRFELVYLFSGISILYLLLGYLSNNMIFTEDFYINAWSENFSMTRIHKLLEFNRRWTWVVYLITPCILFLKTAIITLIIQARLFLNESSHSFKKILKVVLMAELIPLGYALIQFGYFLFIKPHSFDEVNSFAPFSLMSIFSEKTIPGYFTYPLQYISIFEIAYWAILAIGLQAYLGNSFKKSIKLVASSYGICAMIWLIAIMFIQLQMG